MKDEELLILSERLGRWLAEVLAPAGGFGRLEREPSPARGVAGAEAFVVRSRRGERVARLRRGGPSERDPVAVEATLAARARRRLGPALGDAVLAPLAVVVEAEGTCALLPPSRLLEPPRRRRWRALSEPAAEPLLAWLREVTRLTRSEVDVAALEEDFHRPLGWLMADADFPAGARRVARRFRERLEDGSWRPFQALSHGDVARERLERLPRRAWWLERPLAADVALSGWGAARPWGGYPLLDLVSLADGLDLPAPGLRRELDAHCRLLDCPSEEAWGYLLAALGQRGLETARRERAAQARYLAQRRRLCLRLVDALRVEVAPRWRGRRALRRAVRALGARLRRAA